MRVLVTGHDGYIGTVLVPMLKERGHEVVGLDNFLFHQCSVGTEAVGPDEVIDIDIRDVEPHHFAGVDVVMHLAGLSNDPAGDLNPEATYEINHLGTTRVAEAAKAAGVSRFLFSSSCSIYGAHGDEFLDESAEFLPVTPYGESKVLAERDLHAMADDTFSPTYLRNATAYGVSPRLRGDLVVNNLTGHAVSHGQVFLKSDGSSWRPLVHIEDISRAFCALAEQPRELIHDEPFNIGATDENYLIRDVAEIVADVVGCPVTLSDTAFDDLRNYRVDSSKYEALVPDAAAQWTVRRGAETLMEAMHAWNLDLSVLEGPHLQRVKQLLEGQAAGRVTPDLRNASSVGNAP
jgi:nucleoside-diphosphate-sugar epimerase